MTQRLAPVTTDLLATIIHLHNSNWCVLSTTMVMYKHLPYPHIWMIIDLPFLSMKKFKLLFFPNDWIGNHNLLDYLPTNLYDWQWHTCSDGHIAPAHKPSRSVTCNSLLTRLPVWFPDWQSCLFINTTVHHIHAHSGYCLLSHRPTRQLMCETYITS